MAWRVEDGTQPDVLILIPREWGFWSAAFPSPTDAAIVGTGENDDVPWVRMISAEDGRSRLLLVGDQAGGAPVDGAVAPDGRRIVLLVAEPVGRAPEVTTRWGVIELDAADGSVRDTGIAGTVPFPMGTLAVDFAHDAGSFVLWDRTGESATLVDVDDARQTPIRALPNRTGTVGFRALPGGAARLGMDGEITLIDGDGATLQVIQEHDAPVRDAVVSPDGTWAASAGDSDGQLYRWDVDPATGHWSSAGGPHRPRRSCHGRRGRRHRRAARHGLLGPDRDQLGHGGRRRERRDRPVVAVRETCSPPLARSWFGTSHGRVGALSAGPAVAPTCSDLR